MTMAEYKCICCGESRMSEKECSCSSCGYKMFPVPYDRREMLLRQIREFLGQLRVTGAVSELLTYSREAPEKASADAEQAKSIPKAEDDARFPDFEAIRTYVCAADKTEKFVARMEEALRQLRSHLHQPFRQMYKADAAALRERTAQCDAVLHEALRALGLTAELPPLHLPEITADYSETPDEGLLPLADALLERSQRLTAKLHTFIRVNNVYGTAYQQKTRVTAREGADAADTLNRATDALDRVLAKRYMVDLFSDGTEEIREMLTALWGGVSAVMTSPILRPDWRYVLSDGMAVSGADMDDALRAAIRPRYASLDAIVRADDFLADRSENALFDLYSRMIDLDSLGVMGIDRERLSIPGESERALGTLIGLENVKESIRKIRAYAIANSGTQGLNLHMCFYGNPGTGKTEVARIIAGILHENGILPTRKVIEVDRGGLVGQYVGETPQKTKRQIERAMGGVLFIDEAYALVPRQGGFDYGSEAVATLIKAMEDERGRFCVILAGYRNQMQEMLATNPGFQSRIQFELDFPNYSRDELGQIASLMLRQRGYTATDEAMRRLLDVTDVKRREANFANAREIRNLLDQVIMCQNLRCGGTEDRELGLVDVNRFIKDSRISVPMAQGRVLTAEEELEQLIGLSSVKRMVKKIKAYAKRNRDAEDFNLYMCFYGNPGTGKTEVARIISRILYDAGVLSEAKLIETDAHGLTGQYVGETAPKTKAMVQDAMGGVLFVDEAYALSGDGGGRAVRRIATAKRRSPSC